MCGFLADAPTLPTLPINVFFANFIGTLNNCSRAYNIYSHILVITFPAFILNVLRKQMYMFSESQYFLDKT